MRILTHSLSLIIFTVMAFGSLSQTTPDTTDEIYHTLSTNQFEVLPLNPSLPGARFSHLWWSGDNAFSFAARPFHDHRSPGTTAVAKMTDVVTESYGTGGPPPLTYTFITAQNTTPLPKILGQDTIIYVQTYRNAVINDTLYMIITYANPISDLLFDVKLTLNVGPDAVVWTETLDKNGHFLPNGETWDPQDQTIDCGDMGPLEERSILIPVKINSTEERELLMRVDYSHSYGGSGTGSAVSFYEVSPTVARSHDPNVMLEHSDVNTQCDYRGGNIHYTVKFQNEGTGPTNYVRVECHFDDKVDLRSVTGITVPGCYRGNCVEKNSVAMGYVGSKKAIYSIDYSRRVLTIEMDHLILESIMDTNLRYIDRSRDQIEFDILVNDNYLFGPPVLSYSEIFFDKNGAIVTNLAETGCDAPISLDKGGGFQCEDSSVICKYKWYFLGGICLLLLVLFLLLIRKRKKKKITSLNDPKSAK